MTTATEAPTRTALVNCHLCCGAATYRETSSGMVFFSCLHSCQTVGPVASLPDYREPEFANWNRIAARWNDRQAFLARGAA